MTSEVTTLHDAITLIQIFKSLTFTCKFRKLKVI